MKVEGEARQVTVYLNSTDQWHGRPLYSAIVRLCQDKGIAGATVSRGVMGFGKNSRIHRAHFLGLSDDLPERIEIVDRPDQIAALKDAFFLVGDSEGYAEDWLDTTTPRQWRFRSSASAPVRYDWSGTSGAFPFPV